MSRLFNAVSKSALRNGTSALMKNIKNDIQYDHIAMYLQEQNGSSNLLSAIDTYEFKRIVNTAVTGGITIQQSIAQFIESVEQLTSVISSIKPDTYTTANSFLSTAKIRFGGTHYDLSNSKELTVLKERAVNAQRIAGELKVLAAPRKGFTVPKNSDKSSDELRTFICKPIVNEVITASIIHANSHRIATKRVELADSRVEVFGPRVDSRGRFIPYIFEYDMLNASIEKYSKTHTSLIITDISKYFPSIKSRDIVALFTRILSFKESRVLGEQLRFDYLENDGSEQRYSDGLTIESNYQHFIANVYMESVLSEFLTHTNLDGVNIRILSYIDDVFIFVDHHNRTNIEATNIDILNKFERFISSMYSLDINKSKTRIIDDLDEKSVDIKGLIRLPTSNYFDLLFASFKEYEPISDSLGVDPEDLLQAYIAIGHIFAHTNSSVNSSYVICNDIKTSSTLVKDILLKVGAHAQANNLCDRFITTRCSEILFHNANAKKALQQVISPKFFSYVPQREGDTYLQGIRRSYDHVIDYMHANDMEFYLTQYDTFKFDSELVATMGDLGTWRLGDNAVFLPEEKDMSILRVLQYLYLCRTTTVEEICVVINTCMALISVFPNKSRFIAGVIKRHIVRAEKSKHSLSTGRSKYPIVSEEGATIDSLRSLVFDDYLSDEMFSKPNFQYFKYCLNRITSVKI